MKIDNQGDYNRFRGQLAFATLFFMTLVSLGILYDFYSEYLIHIPSWIYSVFFGVCFILYLIYRGQMQYYIIIFDDEEDINSINLKFYPMTALFPKYNMLKIPKNALYKIELQKSFMNRREEIVIYQKMKEGIAKYKPISLSALNKENKKKLIEGFNLYAKIKLDV